MKKTVEKFRPKNRADVVDLSDTFAGYIGDEFEEKPDNDVVTEVGGHYAAEKSLVADAIKAKLTGTDLEDPRWKSSESIECKIRGLNATITFVNARHDIGYLKTAATLRKRLYPGPVFISNRPIIDLRSNFAAKMLPPSSMKIDVLFPEGEKRPWQLGPLKFGDQKAMGPREIILERYFSDSSCIRSHILPSQAMLGCPIARDAALG